VAVDYAGHPADLEEIQKICDKHNLLFIEDASHALGSTYKNNYVGSIADITTFSFFPTKNITTGEGGAIACKDSQTLQKARRFARQGLVREKKEFKITTEGPWHQEVHEFGLNYRLPDILAALGSSQLNRLIEFKSKRDYIFCLYENELSKINHVILPKKLDYVDPFWHLYPIRVPAENRQKIFEKLRANGIQVQVNYLPSHMQPVFKGSYASEDFPNSYEFYKQEISLPIYPDLNLNQIQFICNLIKLN
jgi:dTDP-4-amino-4,6-dideoxygalactose transaminase